MGFHLPPKENSHTSLRLLTALSLYEDHANTASTLGQDKRWNATGLLIRILNIGLLFVEIDVKLNHGNSCVWPITALLIGVKPPMVCNGGMAPPRPQLVLKKQIGPEQRDIWKLSTNTENLELGLDISQGRVTVITIPSIIIIHILYKFAFPFVTAIGNLQFNKTLRSVICIDCKLYTSLNSSISLKTQIPFDSSISM